MNSKLIKTDSKVKVVILAGGNGSRMKGKVPKVIKPFLGIPIIKRITDVINKITIIDEVIIVTSPSLLSQIEMLVPGAQFIIQETPKGTADALNQVIPFLNPTDQILVIPADIPLINERTITKMIKSYLIGSADILVAIVRKNNPAGYGRIIYHGGRLKIVEEKEANSQQKKVKWVNTSIYIFNVAKIIKPLGQITSSNCSNEFYLTDLFNYIDYKQTMVKVKKIYSGKYVEGVNDEESLMKLEKKGQKKVNI